MISTNDLASLLTLVVLEIILGVDNLVFISILTGRLAKHQQRVARQIGLIGALVMRLIFLAGIVWIIHLTNPLFSVTSYTFSGRDIFLILGGLFLLYKATSEIHNVYESAANPHEVKRYANFAMVVSQIMLFDIIFSLDSILTAVGLTEKYWIMATAITIAILLMLFTSHILSDFIHRHPTIKMLALSFLLLIGTVLIADGFQFHVPRGYIYFAVCFSIIVEGLNSTLRNRFKQKRIVKQKLKSEQRSVSSRQSE